MTSSADKAGTGQTYAHSVVAVTPSQSLAWSLAAQRRPGQGGSKALRRARLSCCCALQLGDLALQALNLEAQLLIARLCQPVVETADMLDSAQAVC